MVGRGSGRRANGDGTGATGAGSTRGAAMGAAGTGSRRGGSTRGVGRGTGGAAGAGASATAPVMGQTAGSAITAVAAGAVGTGSGVAAASRSCSTFSRALKNLLTRLPPLGRGTLEGFPSSPPCCLLWQRVSEPAGSVGSEDEEQHHQHHDDGDAAAGRPHRGAARHQPGLTAALPLRPFAFLEILDRLVDDAGIDPLLAVGVARQQAVVAYDVDDAGCALAVLGDPLDRRVGEDAGVGRPRDAEAVPDVEARLLGGQRADVAAQSDALLELAQLGHVELVAQLGLADEEDLHQLLAGRLEVREQAHRLQRLHREVLRLVDDQDRAQPLPVLVDEELVELEQPLGVGGAHRLHAPVVQDVLQQPLGGEGGVVHVGHVRVAVEPLQQRAQERGLAGPDLAAQHDEALALAHSIEELRQGFAVPARLEQELGVRRRREGRLAEAVELEVHDYLFTAAVASGVRSVTSDWLLCATMKDVPTTASKPTATAASAMRRCRADCSRSCSVTMRGIVESTGTPAVARTSSARRYEVSTCSASTTATPAAPKASTRPTISRRRRLGPAGRSGSRAWSITRKRSPFWRCSSSAAMSASPRLARSWRNISRVVS